MLRASCVIVVLGFAMMSVGCGGRGFTGEADGLMPVSMVSGLGGAGAVTGANGAALPRFALEAGTEMSLWGEMPGLNLCGTVYISGKIGVAVGFGSCAETYGGLIDWDYDVKMVDVGVEFLGGQGAGSSGPYSVVGVAFTEITPDNDGTSSYPQQLLDDGKVVWAQLRGGYRFVKNKFTVSVEGRAAIGDAIVMQQDDGWGTRGTVELPGDVSLAVRIGTVF